MDLIATLKKSFGYDQFRPLQQEIISDALEGRDVFVLMPTGGGKSLCFQLPALLRNGLTIVVSPLISLMKDQVDALQTSGIPATYLNSTLDRDESKARWRGLHRGEYRMLYVAPERLMLETFLERALNWRIAQFAIDEAHCISEWGHDFRPEYRDLKKLREHFPDAPVMALTATATERVRADIVKQLKLREPRCYVASFDRPNLTYRVIPKSAPYEQLLALIRSRPNDGGIVYCASRKSTESVARNLNEDGISAKPYHAGLTPSERTKHQESFLRDDVRVITATFALSFTTTCRKIWRAIIRRPDARGATDCPANASCCSVPATLPSKSISSMKRVRAKLASPGRSFSKWCITRRHANAGAQRSCDTLASNTRSHHVKGAIIASRRARRSMAQFRRRNFSPAYIASTRKADSDLD